MAFTFPKDPLAYIRGDERPRAIASLRGYFDRDFTGAHFEQLSDYESPKSFTPTDLVAVTMLAVRVPGRAALTILGDEVATLLGDIPASEHALWEDGGALDRGGNAWSLYRLLTGLNRIGQTTASKLLAAKRPHLLPVYDSVLRDALGIKKIDRYWAAWRAVFASESVREEVAAVRAEADLADHLSLLRTLDIVIWMRHRGWQQTGQDDFPDFEGS